MMEQAICNFILIVAGSASLLIFTSFTWNPGETHTLTLTMVGSLISCKVDGIDITGSPLVNGDISAIGHGGSRILALQVVAQQERTSISNENPGYHLASVDVLPRSGADDAGYRQLSNSCQWVYRYYP